MKFNKKYLIVFLLTAGLSIWNIVYLPSFFYTPFLNAFKLSNEQMGNLLSMYGILAVIGYFLGGLVSDRYSPKWLMVISTISTGLLGLLMATFPSYNTLLMIYMGFGITAVLLYWSAFVKSIRMMGNQDEQGKLFGAFESFYGIVSLVLSYIILLMFSSYIAENGHFEYVIISYSVITIVIGILIAVIFKPEKHLVYKDESDSSFSFKLVPEALKLPVTWFNSIIVFLMFMIISGALYLNPYLNSVFMVPVTWATALGITIKYGFRMIASPIGGGMVDKYKKSSTVLMISSALIVITGLVLILVPKDPSYLVAAMIAVFAFCVVFNLPRSCMYVPVAEVKVPLHILGTVVGIVSAIGYSSDIYIWKVFGALLDKHGDLGYIYIFGIMTLCGAALFVTAVLYNKYLTNYQSENQITERAS